MFDPCKGIFDGADVVGDLAQAETQTVQQIRVNEADVLNNEGRAQAADVVKVTDVNRNAIIADLTTRFGIASFYAESISHWLTLAQRLTEIKALVDTNQLSLDEGLSMVDLAIDRFESASETTSRRHMPKPDPNQDLYNTLAQIFGPGVSIGEGIAVFGGQR